VLSIYALSVLLIVYFSGLECGDEYKSMDESKVKIEIHLLEKSYSTLSNHNLIYVGETSFIFILYDKASECSIVINKESVIEYKVFKSE